VSVTEGPLGVVPVVVLLGPLGPGVGVVVDALFIRLPVAPAATVPVIRTVAVDPAAKSANVALPLQAPIVAPLTLYCGFCTDDGT
jgi:hypothetical protein